MSEAMSVTSSSLRSPEITTASPSSAASAPASTAACIRREISSRSCASSVDSVRRTASNDLPEKCTLKKLPASSSSASV
ncbi:Uncharacterised protein [Bordetella pertussis]|nr:Uncharacterised protein [Bordetella pertussis]CFW40374.1 Uncharacterised protein [Bordetella pertussis]